MRKVKHVTVTVSSTEQEGLIWWALVYVPQGTNPNPMQVGPNALSLYEPNQFVMAAGLSDLTAGPVRIRSPVSRNLNSGDAIYLVYGMDVQAAYVSALVEYAITLQ